MADGFLRKTEKGTRRGGCPFGDTGRL